MSEGQASTATEQPPARATSWIGVTGLQCELRNLFASMPVHRALSAGLKRVAQSLSGRYAVVHAPDGAIIKKTAAARRAGGVEIEFQDGRVGATVTESAARPSPKRTKTKPQDGSQGSLL